LEVILFDRVHGGDGLAELTGLAGLAGPGSGAPEPEELFWIEGYYFCDE